MKLVAVAIVVGLAIALAYMWGLEAKRHTCASPCTVSFSLPMEEDEFGIDYHNHRLDVYRVKP